MKKVLAIVLSALMLTSLLVFTGCNNTGKGLKIGLIALHDENSRRAIKPPILLGGFICST